MRKRWTMYVASALLLAATAAGCNNCNGPVPPPGPIIDADPTKSSSIFTIGGTAANGISETGNFINEKLVGEIKLFQTTFGAHVVKLKKMQADFKFNGTTKTLVVEKASSGFNWTLDGQVLDPVARSQTHDLREDLAKADLVSSIVVTKDDDTTADASAVVRMQTK